MAKNSHLMVRAKAMLSPNFQVITALRGNGFGQKSQATCSDRQVDAAQTTDVSYTYVHTKSFVSLYITSKLGFLHHDHLCVCSLHTHAEEGCVFVYGMHDPAAGFCGGEFLSAGEDIWGIDRRTRARGR